MTQKTTAKTHARARQKRLGESYTTALQHVLGPSTAPAVTASQAFPARVSTGLQGFDALVGGGIVPGTFVLVAGFSGSGRSCFVEGLARQFARASTSVLFASSEMDPARIFRRGICAEANLDGTAVKFNRLSADQREAFERTGKTLSALPLRFKRLTDGVWGAHAVASIRKIAEMTPRATAVIIDRIDNLEEFDVYEGTRQDASGVVASSLAALVSDLQATLFGTLAVGTRGYNLPARLELTPEGAALRDRADMVLMLHPDPEDERSVKIEVIKNRHGAVGECMVWFDRPRTRFLDVPAAGFQTPVPPYSHRLLDRRYRSSEIQGVQAELVQGRQVLKTPGILLLRAYLTTRWPLLAVLAGPKGTGKSTAAAWAAVRSGPSFAFRRTSTLERTEYWDELTDVALLILDGCDGGMDPDWPEKHDRIRSLLSARVLAGLPTLLTVDLYSRDQFAEQYLHPAALDRLVDLAWWHELSGSDQVLRTSPYVAGSAPSYVEDTVA